MEGIKILIVEDEVIIADNLHMMLEDLGYFPIEPASNFQEARDLLASQSVDIAILDINLNGISEGIDIGAYIREKYGIPFIYLTSYSDKETIGKARQTLPASYLIKPFTREEIYAAIEVALQSFTRSTPAPDAEEFIPVLADCIFIKLGNKHYKVKIDDISWMESDGKLVHMYTVLGQKFTVKASLESLMVRFENYPFVRIHRSFCINASHLTAINHDHVFMGDTAVSIGRNYRDSLLKKINTLH